MIGIRFDVVRESDGAAGNVVTTLYLRSRRLGGAGDAMRADLREYRRQVAASMRGLNRVVCAEKEDGDADHIDAAQAAAMEAARAANEAALAAAQRVALAALRDNYGEKTDEIVDGLTDRELHTLVQTIEVGQMPADFSRSPDTPPNKSSTGRSGGEPGKPS